MKLFIHGINSIIAHGLLAISDKLNFIDEADIINSEENLKESCQESKPTILIVSIQLYFSSQYLKQLVNSFKNINLILMVDLYRLEVDKIKLDTDLADIIICKDCKEYEFIHALWAAKESDKYFCSELLNYILRGKGNEVISNENLMALTEREIEVLKLIGQGYSSIQIADTLFISKHTVNSHRKRIMQKLNLQKPAQLIQVATNVVQ